ncbi:MAG: IS1634 family transposase [Acidobacteria bacterium]|nr:IS1634 family transposase [Acidobacteriota bacterium]
MTKTTPPHFCYKGTMFLRKTTKRYKGKTYTHHLLVETVRRPEGPRQQTVCSLGDLSPGPREKWLALAHQVDAALHGQRRLVPEDPQVTELLERWVRSQASSSQQIIAVLTDEVRVEQAREAGTVHVGHQMWRRLGLETLLKDLGFSRRARWLSELMVLNRLICPASEHAMPEWARRTALADVLGADLDALCDEALYRQLDRLHPHRAAIEAGLAEREKTLFNLDDSYLLYDLTSTYFEGQCARNPKAQRGYSRDHRPDCKQVVVGLVLDRDGFPKAHEVFEGRLQDRQSLAPMLEILEQRTGRRGQGTVIVDRGMAFEENLTQLQERGYHYVVACRQSERTAWLEDLEEEAGWEQLLRQPSPRNPKQRKSELRIKRLVRGSVLYVACQSQGREAKDRAIRLKQETRLVAALRALSRRVESGGLRRADKIHQAIGRLRERFPRVARYYRIDYELSEERLCWQETVERKQRAEQLDGVYLLKTDRLDLSADEVWRLYILLTRVEKAFRDMKSPLSERPIFHQLQRRVETHIFLCVLAYHLLISIEKSFLDRGVHISWASLREQLRTHQVVTTVLPTTDGSVLRIRQATNPEASHREIYRTLGLPQRVMKPIRTWGRERM